MGRIYETLEPLEADSRLRVLKWAIAKFDVRVTIGARIAGDGAAGSSGIPTGATDIASYESLPEFFAALDLPTEHERVLAVGAYLMGKDKHEELTSQQINSELKNLGFGVSNITRAIGTLLKQKPQPMIQTRKEGKSRQAIKKFRVTQHGFSRVQRWLSGEQGDASGGEE